MTYGRSEKGEKKGDKDFAASLSRESKNKKYRIRSETAKINITQQNEETTAQGRERESPGFSTSHLTLCIQGAQLEEQSVVVRRLKGLPQMVRSTKPQRCLKRTKKMPDACRKVPCTPSSKAFPLIVRK